MLSVKGDPFISFRISFPDFVIINKNSIIKKSVSDIRLWV